MQGAKSRCKLEGPQQTSRNGPSKAPGRERLSWLRASSHANLADMDEGEAAAWRRFVRGQAAAEEMSSRARSPVPPEAAMQRLPPYAVSRRPIAVTPVATKKRISSSTVVGQRFDGQFRRLTPVRNERLVAASGPGRSGARAAPLVRTLHAHWGARRSTTRISAPHLENAGCASDNDLALNPRQVEFCDDKNNAHIPLIVEQCYDDIDNHCSGCSSMQVRCARTRRGALLKR